MILPLIRDLFPYATGIVAPDNDGFFSRLQEELPLTLHRFASGTSFNGWTVPQCWHAVRATISREGRLLFDACSHPLGVAAYSKSFQGDVDFETLKAHVVTRPALPSAFSYHCEWPYRPWQADWALSVPHETFGTFGPGRYQVDLQTAFEPGAMLVGEYEHRGTSDRTIVFNAHTCHPRQANDDLGGVAVLVRLFQWLQGRQTYYTYRLVLGPEHFGTVFYLRDRPEVDLRRMVGGAFAEMPSTGGPVKIASTFLGEQPIDRAFRHAARHHTRAFQFVPWRQGAGNDETVWEAPGYEVPFVEVSRSLELLSPFPEYHTSLDNLEMMDEGQLNEFLGLFRHAIEILEQNAVLHRRFTGLVCLSNPIYGLYQERPDPAIHKQLEQDSEKWGYLLDCLLRYFDGSMTILDIADRHDLPFDRVYRYVKAFEEKGLVEFEFAPVPRVAVSQPRSHHSLGAKGFD
jgi:aminopeptidase-like protein